MISQKEKGLFKNDAIRALRLSKLDKHKAWEIIHKDPHFGPKHLAFLAKMSEAKGMSAPTNAELSEDAIDGRTLNALFGIAYQALQLNLAPSPSLSSPKNGSNGKSTNKDKASVFSLYRATCDTGFVPKDSLLQIWAYGESYPRGFHALRSILKNEGYEFAEIEFGWKVNNSKSRQKAQLINEVANLKSQLSELEKKLGSL